MKTDERLEAFPLDRIKPVDGLIVTAAIWEEAHDYHRLRERFHNRLGHGPGILTGLDVVASDPPDTSVYVLPGMAVDPSGEVIAVVEPVAYDLGAAQGSLHLLLTYGEGRPHQTGGALGQDTGDLLRVRAEFGIEARPSLADATGVELARLRRQGRQAPIGNAPDPEHPAPNEIDLRFRRTIGAGAPPVASMAVCRMGEARDAQPRRGASALARVLRTAGQALLWVDDVPLGTALDGYTLVYLFGECAFTLNSDEMTVLYDYLQGGGTILVESCCREPDAAGQADAAFLDLLGSLGVELEAVPPGHPLLTEPHLFAAPPPGANTAGDPRLLAGGGVVFSGHDYGCLWQGKGHGDPPSREKIRSAHEWGQNLVAYALRRRSGEPANK